MKTWIKTIVSTVCVIAMMLSILCVVPMTTSAVEVIPTALVRQNLAKWKNYTYGDSLGTLYRTGCGMFAIVNSVGYLTGNEMDVTEVAAWGHAIGGYNPGNTHAGTYRMTIYPRLQAKYGERYGFTVDCGSTNEGYWGGSSSTRLKNHLANGGVAIGHVPGHFIAIVGYNSSSNKFHVYDSYPTTARGTGSGDCWVTQSHLATGKLKLDWYCLLTSTGTVINNKTVSESTADKIGTYKITTPVDDPLNVRSGAGTSYDILDTANYGDIVNVTALNGNWGKFVTVNKKVEGWASIKNYGEYIGVDVLAQTQSAAWGDVTTSVDSKGRLTIANSGTEYAAYDFRLPFSIGTATTPYLSLQITPNKGDGYYFGLTQYGSGFFMMRDCNSSDQLVHAETAPYMTNTETLEIDVDEWWTSKTSDWAIDQVRVYVAPQSSITINYMYFAAGSGVVKDETYNLNSNTHVATDEEVKPVVNENLMKPETLNIVDRTKTGGYVYDNGKLTVTSGSDEGYEVAFDLNWEYTPEATPDWMFDATGDVRFDIEMIVTTSDGDRTFGLVADFAPYLCPNGADNGYLPAGTYTNMVDIHSCYTWNGILPEDGLSVIKQVKIKVGGTGTVTVNALQVSDVNEFSTYADGVHKEDSTVAGTKGDIDSDGDVTTVDARMLLQYSLDMITFTDAQKSAADYDGDGVLSTADVRKMLQALIG